MKSAIKTLVVFCVLIFCTSAVSAQVFQWNSSGALLTRHFWPAHYPPKSGPEVMLSIVDPWTMAVQRDIHQRGAAESILYAAISPSEQFVFTAHHFLGDADVYYLHSLSGSPTRYISLYGVYQFAWLNDENIVLLGDANIGSIKDHHLAVFNLSRENRSVLVNMSSDQSAQGVFIDGTTIWYALEDGGASGSGRGVWQYRDGVSEQVVDFNDFGNHSCRLIGQNADKIYVLVRPPWQIPLLNSYIYAIDLHTSERLRVFETRETIHYTPVLSPDASSVLIQGYSSSPDVYYYYSVHPVPEPSTMVVLASGMGAMLLRWRKVKR